MLKFAPLMALLLAGQAKAAGFALAEQGAAASGNASAHTASKDSPDLAYFNPALLALSPGFRAQLGASFLFSSLEHDGEALTKSESPPGTPPTLKLSYIHDFEAMLRIILSARDGNALGVAILSSDMGKLYVALAQAIERLRQ